MPALLATPVSAAAAVQASCRYNYSTRTNSSGVQRAEGRSAGGGTVGYGLGLEDRVLERARVRKRGEGVVYRPAFSLPRRFNLIHFYYLSIYVPPLSPRFPLSAPPLLPRRYLT